MNHNKIASLHRQILNASHYFSVEDKEFVEVFEQNEPYGEDGGVDNILFQVVWSDEIGHSFEVVITEGILDNAVLIRNDIEMVVDIDDTFCLRLFLIQQVPLKVEWDQYSA
jgi:hypothetical protein